MIKASIIIPRKNPMVNCPNLDFRAVDRPKELFFLLQYGQIRAETEIRSLQTMPQRFPFFNEDYIPANKYHKLYVENWYLVLYQIKDDTVYVDWILDCRQDYSWLLR